MRRRVQVRQPHGYVLVITLGVLAVIGIMALSLGTATQGDLEQARRLQDETAAEFLAKAGIEWTLHYLNETERQGTMWQAAWSQQAAHFRARKLGPGLFDISYLDPAGTLRYGFQDEEARININSAPAAILAALPGVGPAVAEAIVAQRQQENWAEPEALVRRGLLSATLWDGEANQGGVGAYVTVWSNGKINVNTAPPAVLATLPGITAQMVQAIVQYRQGEDQRLGTTDDRYFRSVHEVSTLPDIGRTAWQQFESFLTVTPSAFRVIATGRTMSGRASTRSHRRLAIVERASGKNVLRYWRKLGS